MRKLFKNLGLLFGGLGLIASSPAEANVGCQFVINNVSLSNTADLTVTVTNNGTVYSWGLCNVQGSVTVSSYPNNTATFTSGACNALFAQLLTARTSGTPMWWGFFTVTACAPSSLPANGWITGSASSATFPWTFVL